MDFICDERQSDSPFIERIWRSQSERNTLFTSLASAHWEIVITKVQGKTSITVRGPETQASQAFCPVDGEWIGIQFKTGALMPLFPAQTLMNRQDVNLPDASSQSFWLNGAAWQYFDYENAETFVDHLVRNDLLVHDPVVENVMNGQPVHKSLRTVQRRILQATGLSHNDIYQIRRARFATSLLKQGLPILDVIDKAGYSDQPHLTRSLRHYIGETPAQIIGANRENPLSFLFKTSPF